MKCPLRARAGWLVVAVASALAGCGGGGSGEEASSSGGGGSGNGTPTGTNTRPTATIDLDAAAGTVPIGGELTINATARDVSGQAIEGASFSWQSSNAAIATVGNGVVTAVALGTATISIQSGAATSSYAVTVIPELPGMVKAGSGHACGITKLGSAYCWGNNEHRQLGASSTADKSSVPLRVVGDLPFMDIAPGSSHTCALTVAGKAYCWGLNAASDLLGDGDAATDLFVAAPFPVATTQTFKSIDASDSQTCALTADGDAYCWPRTLQSGVKVTTPSLIGGGLKFASISVGSAHVCALTAAGKAYCWGWNGHQQLGYASFQNAIDDPVPVAGGHTFAEITAGTTHSCARTTAGRVYCWGDDQEGKLGDGDAYAPGHTPRPIAGSHDIVSVSASGSFTSAITASGAVIWWGAYSPGCSLDGIMNGQSCPNEDQANSPKGLGSYGFTSVSAGGLFNVGLTQDGRTGSWWYNSHGQLGDGSTTTFRTTPSLGQRDFQIVAESTSVTVTPGQSLTIPVTVNRTGGFTTSGVGLAEPIDLTLQSATGYSGSFRPARIGPEQSRTTLTLSPASSLPPGSTTLTMRGQATGGAVKTAAITATVPGATGGGAGGTLDLVCTSESTSLPSGYHCMRNSAGQLVPGRYSYTAMHGTWVDEVGGLCINWGANGLATGRYKPAQLGGGSVTTTPSGKWGVIVRRSGAPEGTSTQWYVFTAPLDPQTVLLGYDSTTNRILHPGFEKRSSCPW